MRSSLKPLPLRYLLLIMFVLAAVYCRAASFVAGVNGTINSTPTAYAGLGLGGGGRIGCAWNKSKLLFCASATKNSFYAELQFTYKVGPIAYAGIVAGGNSITTDYSATGSGYHAGAVAGFSSPVGKRARLFAELSPRVCFDEVTTFRSQHGLGYHTNDGRETHLAIPLNIGVNFYIGGGTHKASAAK